MGADAKIAYSSLQVRPASRVKRELAEAFAGFAVVEIALWSVGVRQFIWGLAALTLVAVFTLRSGRGGRDLGITGRGFRQSIWLVPMAVLIAAIMTSGAWLAGSLHILHGSRPVLQASVYSVWAIVQQFLVQSFVFVRLEAVAGRRAGIVATALLFAVAHIPNPLLIAATLVAGLALSWLFSRYRNIYVLGIVHAVLGLAVAVSVPDCVTHQMRVGTAYGNYVQQVSHKVPVSGKGKRELLGFVICNL